MLVHDRKQRVQNLLLGGCQHLAFGPHVEGNKALVIAERVCLLAPERKEGKEGKARQRDTVNCLIFATD